MSDARLFEDFVKDLESDEEIKDKIAFARAELAEFKARRKQGGERGDTDLLGLQVQVAVEIMTLHNWHLCAQGLVSAVDEKNASDNTVIKELAEALERIKRHSRSKFYSDICEEPLTKHAERIKKCT